MYILVRVIVLCLFGAHSHGGGRSEPSLGSLAENHKMEILTFTDGEYTCEM